MAEHYTDLLDGHPATERLRCNGLPKKMRMKADTSPIPNPLDDGPCFVRQKSTIYPELVNLGLAHGIADQRVEIIAKESRMAVFPIF